MAKVTIYTTPTCVYCKVAKAFFKEHDVIYEEKNVAADREAAKEAMEKSGQMAVPIIDVDGTIIVGFDKSHLSQLLGIK
ncbi:MAG: glutathione S-transferase N-terminal domain-containing protein [Candidatus Yanofskybacteria bacterium]|nr:glutathione S-transferase N-terminal domain-containing protein [Candidatus Yanofskybacteria bacterium]